MKSQRLTGIRILLSLCFLTVGQATAQESNISSADYLAPFAMLVGGEWHIDGFYQTLTWGVGKKSIISKGYFVDTAGKSKLVSEGMWYWDPAEKKIKGRLVAIDMPIDFFDYETKFEGQTMVNRLKSYKPDGEQYGDFIETWEIMDENHYTWTLSQKSDGKKVMGGNFVRKKKKD